VRQANVSGMEAYREPAKSEKDYEGFWGKIARDNLIWHKVCRFANVSYNCLKRHKPHKTAIIFNNGQATASSSTCR
jgi:acetyl-CoA synthetase